MNVNWVEDLIIVLMKTLNVSGQIYHFSKIIHDFQDNINFLSVKGSLA